MNSPDNTVRQIDLIKIYGTKRCLVVDDYPEIRGSLMRSLRNFGAETVDTAADGEETIRLCQQSRYDFVLCDYNLGAGKDGQQVLEEVRHLGVLPMTSLFVMLTAESSREMVLGALECQPDDYITKPYTENSLRTRLNRALLRHEALLPIKKAIGNGDYQRAINGCDDMIRSGGRYARECIKMKGQLLLRVRQLDEARSLYQSVLDKKPLVWAQLGMAKTLIELGKLGEAEKLLQAIIREDARYIEAHDLMAEIHSMRNDTVHAQQATETATQVSPKSAHRHRKLANLADINGDDELSAKSHLNAIRWGVNSCHESPQDYFNYARKVADTVRKGTSTDTKALVKQVNGYLERAAKRYGQSPEFAVQSVMAQAQLNHSQGKVDEAKQQLARARDMYQELAQPDPDITLNLARTLYNLDEEEQARELLTSLAGQYPDDKKLMNIIDSTTREPISNAGKEAAARLTKSGITCYERKDFAVAIDVFREALTSYPRHVGLNLNLIQAVLAASEQDRPTPVYEDMCRRSLRAIGAVTPQDKHYKRYTFLQKQIDKLYPALSQQAAGA